MANSGIHLAADISALSLQSQPAVSAPLVVNRARWAYPESNSIPWLNFFKVGMIPTAAVLNALLCLAKETRAASVWLFHFQSAQFNMFNF